MKENCEETGREIYSEFNYYYQSEEERKVLNTGKYEINDGLFIVDVTVDSYNIDNEECYTK